MRGRSANQDDVRRSEPAPEPVPAAPLIANQEAELGSLARELARGYAELVESHRRTWGIGTAEAEEKARTPRERALELVRSDPPEQMTWWRLSTVMEHDPAAALDAWKRITTAARQEWRSGHRTAQVLEQGHKPWDRARFLVLREAFRDDWHPRGGVEAALIDLLAESFSEYLAWTERLTLYTETQGQSEDVKLKAEGHWLPPRMGEAKWMAWCAEQATASHRRFLMTLKTMQDLRRLPAMSITSVAQVNVAQQMISSQVNTPGSAVNDLAKSSGDTGPHRKLGSRSS
jgi:hypothetical protein